MEVLVVLVIIFFVGLVSLLIWLSNLSDENQKKMVELENQYIEESSKLETEIFIAQCKLRHAIEQELDEEDL